MDITFKHFLLTHVCPNDIKAISFDCHDESFEQLNMVLYPDHTPDELTCCLDKMDIVTDDYLDGTFIVWVKHGGWFEYITNQQLSSWEYFDAPRMPTRPQAST